MHDVQNVPDPDMGRFETPPRSRGPSTRNIALDYIRTLALLLMSLIHMWRDLLGRGAVDRILLSAGETAPVFFFVAFGMTQNRMVKKNASEVMRFVVLSGFIAVFQSYFLFSAPVWDFFPFLWAALLLVLLGNWLGLSHRQFLLLSVAVLVVNMIRPLGVSLIGATLADGAFAQRLWLFPGGFFPLPWAVLVFLGFALGMQYRPMPRDLVMAAAGMTVVVALNVVVALRPDVPLAYRLTLSKWSATSPYLVFGCAEVLLVYAGLDYISRFPVAEKWFYPTTRFVSDNLMVGTVLHYLVLMCLTAQFSSWWRLVNGVRTANWGIVLLLSIANVVFLVGALKLLARLWGMVSQRLHGVLGRLGIAPVALTAVAIWAVLRFGVGFVSLGFLKWTAYAAMLLLALLYDYHRKQARGAGETAESAARVFTAVSRRTERAAEVAGRASPLR